MQAQAQAQIWRVPPLRMQSNRILIKTDMPEKMAGSIEIPDTALDEGRHWSGLTCRTARVIAMGPGLRVHYSKWRGHEDERGVPRWPMPAVHPGSHILYRAWSGHDVVIDGESYQIISGNVVDAEILPDGQLSLFEDRLLVRRRPPNEKTRGGLWIPEIAQRSSLEGEVLQTGPGKIVATGATMPMDAHAGDRVSWRPLKGVDVTKHYHGRASGDEIVLLFETDLIGVMDGAENFDPVVSIGRER